MLYKLHLRSHFWTNFNDSEKSGFLPFGDFFLVILFSQICNQFSHQLSFWFGAFLFLKTGNLNFELSGTGSRNGVEQAPETEWLTSNQLFTWLGIPPQAGSELTVIRKPTLSQSLTELYQMLELRTLGTCNKF